MVVVVFGAVAISACAPAPVTGSSGSDGEYGYATATVCLAVPAPLTLEATSGFYDFYIAVPTSVAPSGSILGTANAVIPPVVTQSLPAACYLVSMNAQSGSFSYRITW